MAECTFLNYLKLPAPKNIADLCRLLGMVNQARKFSPYLTELNEWTWGKNQAMTFARIKAELSKPTVLALYNPTVESKISTDSSSYGLGAVLLQKHDTTWRPSAFASLSLTGTKCCYMEIEKEVLAITWACDKFADYVLGKGSPLRQTINH